MTVRVTKLLPKLFLLRKILICPRRVWVLAKVIYFCWESCELSAGMCLYSDSLEKEKHELRKFWIFYDRKELNIFVFHQRCIQLKSCCNHVLKRPIFTSPGSLGVTRLMLLSYHRRSLLTFPFFRVLSFKDKLRVIKIQAINQYNCQTHTHTYPS